MASQSQGVQQLLAAEKKAAEKVAEARKRKARRLKQAKDEAQAEIEKFRLEREAAYKQYEAKLFSFVLVICKKRPFLVKILLMRWALMAILSHFYFMQILGLF
ncbi:Atp6v1g [Hyalella azteca]|uniref:V-type proton ATPase subunit G n=1 Tax=Hyalella azteca TaxID=294128 RepID=A0A6A0GZB6_HYAAZ|nr:Atp6v1g [Hyalella azteca]